MVKKRVKRKVVKHEAPVHVVQTHSAQRSRLNKDKGDGIMAIMAAVLVTLIAVLNPTYGVVAAVLMMIIFAIYKLLFRR